MKPSRLGTVLFNAIFKQKIRDLFNTSLGSVRRTHGSEKLRLQFNLTDAPELAVLPWELIFNAENSSFYAQSTETPIVRYLDIPMPIRTLRVAPPLNVLVAISSPSDQAQLDSERGVGEAEKRPSRG